MISNQNIFTSTQPSPKSKRLSFNFFGKRRSSRGLLKETNSPQTRDPVGKPESMDVSQRESLQPFLTAQSPKSSIEAMCFRLDMGANLPEHLPRIDNSSKRGQSGGLVRQPANIFRGVQLDANGAVQKERKASGSAGQGKRLGKRSRQADNINRARSLASFREANDEASSSSSNMVSLFVIGECDALDDLIRYAPRKKVAAENKEREDQDQPAKETSSIYSTGTPQHLREIHVLV